MVTVPPGTSMRRLGQRVGGHDGLGGLQPVARRKVRYGLGNGRDDAFDGQVLQNDASGHGQHGGNRHPEGNGHGIADLAGVFHPLGTGAGIGHAGVDHQRPHFPPTGLEMLARQRHGRGAETVAGKDGRRPRPLAEADHQQVTSAGLADTGAGGTQFDAGYGQQAGRFGGGEIDGHGASSVIALGVRLAMLGKGITRLHRAAPVLSEALLTKP